MLSNILDRVSFWSLFLTVTLLPLFFIPFTGVPVETSKNLILVLGLVVSLVTWAAARFSDGRVVLPRSPLILAGGGVALSVLVSALFAVPKGTSFFGSILSFSGTFWFVLLSVLLMTMLAIVVRDDKKSKMILYGLLASSAVAFVFQIARFFAPETLSLGVLGANKTANLVGSWNSFGFLSSLVLFASLFLMDFFSFDKKWVKWALGTLTVISAFMVIAVGFHMIWKVLGVFALIMFVYKISLSASKEDFKDRKEFPVFSFGLMLLCLLFVMSGNIVGPFVPEALNLTNIEISPTLKGSVMMVKDVLKDHPVLGVGPGRFAEAWAMYRSPDVNRAVFWDVSFETAYGTYLSFAVTTGILGILAWLTFLGLFLWYSGKFLANAVKNHMTSEVVLYALGALYLLVVAFFYALSSTVLLIAFAFIGIFIGLYTASKEDGSIELDFLDDPRKSFFSILFLVLLMLVSASFAFKYFERYASFFYYTSAVKTTSIDNAEDYINKAILLYPSDLYYRTYAQVYVVKLNSILNKEGELTEEEKLEAQQAIRQIVEGAENATNYDPKSYSNYQFMGNIYNSLSVLGVEEAGDQAIEAYKKASELNPLNPSLQLSIAQVYLAQKKYNDAETFAKEAVFLKADYANAYVVLSQIANGKGDKAQAVTYAEQALSIVPGNKELVDYIASLKGGSATLEVPVVEEDKDGADTANTDLKIEE